MPNLINKLNLIKKPKQKTSREQKPFSLFIIGSLALFAMLTALHLMPGSASIFLVPSIAILTVTISFVLAPTGVYLALTANLVSAVIIFRLYTAAPEKLYVAFLFLLLLSTMSAFTVALLKKRDNTSLKNLEWLSAIDCLTEAYNHRYFYHRLAEEISRAERNKGEIALAFIDIDNFKVCNDQNGHIMGDMILKKTAKFLKDMTRSHDIVCRYGGDEFVIIFPDIDATGATSIVSRLTKYFPRHVMPGNINNLNKLTLSVGVSSYPDIATDIQDLIQKADRALYFVKNNGKNHVRIYDDMMPAEETEKSDFCYDTYEKGLIENYQTAITGQGKSEAANNLAASGKNHGGNGNKHNRLLVGKALRLCHAGIDPLRLSINLDDLKLH